MIYSRHRLVEFLPVCCSEYKVKEEGTGEGYNFLVYGLRASTTVSMERSVPVAGM